jgi:hypothetical protein
MNRKARQLLCRDKVESAKRVSQYNRQADRYAEQTRQNIREARRIISSMESN